MSDTSTPAKRVRPFYWSVRRELWETPAVFVAPLIAAAVALVPFMIMAFQLPDGLEQIASATDPKAFKRAAGMLAAPFAAASAFIILAATAVGVFYSLSALQAERRDRSILFWKSLPVSDATTVLAKAALPIVVLPVVAFVMILATQVLMLLWGVLIVMAHGSDPALFWKHSHLGLMWTVLTIGLPYVALWGAPVCAWLILVSAWAKRLAILWAVGPFLALMAVEGLSFRTHHVADFVQTRLAGGFARAFSGPGRRPVERYQDIDLVGMATDPNFWGGLVLAALLLFAAIRLRRSREPI